MRNELSPMMTREENARASFCDIAMSIIDCTEDEARDILAFYLREKLARIDYGVGRVNVKHGGLLDDDTLQLVLSELSAAQN